MQFALIHSPLVGPSTWVPVAEQLRERGHGVAVPDLRAAAETGDPHAIIKEAAATIGPRADVVVGHSGAGIFLPSIATQLKPNALSVFVDAGLPPCSGETTASADFLDHLRSIAVDGLLPTWSTWWGGSAMEALIPDERVRRRVVDEMPAVPLALYLQPIQVPLGWCARPSAFLLLSHVYADDAAAARTRHWPVIERHGAHLDILTRASSICDDILELAR